MSLAYSDTTNKDGIIQQIERTVGFDDGGISDNSNLLKYFTGLVNQALDKVFAIIFDVGGTWQFDDSNHTKYPEITTDLVASQRDYNFTTDQQGNLILDIYRVFVKYPSTAAGYNEIYPVDKQRDKGTQGLYDEVDTEGVPYYYDKTANGIFLDLIPEETVTLGLKILINREGSYFVSTDTTKIPGFAGLFHEFLVLDPAYTWARNKSLPQREALMRDRSVMEEKIRDHYSNRERDVRKRMVSKRILYK